MEKFVKARKEHECGYCYVIIPKDSNYFYMEYRDPVFDQDDIYYSSKQIGIQYVKVRYCMKCVKEFSEERIEHTTERGGVMCKAYNVYPGSDPFDYGCILVFAESRNAARSLACRKGPRHEFDYIDFSAIRARDWDGVFKATGRYFIESNDDLPEDAPRFFVDDPMLY